jgi:hypothetical protein
MEFISVFLYMFITYIQAFLFPSLQLLVFIHTDQITFFGNISQPSNFDLFMDSECAKITKM